MPDRSRTRKNPHAVGLGRLGGLAGGPARARKLSSAERSAIASHAARSRWGRPGTRRDNAKMGDSVRERILAAARDEFARAGIAAARLSSIADKARVHQRSINYHFGGKTGLLRELLRLSTAVTMKIAVTQPAPSLRDDLRLWEQVIRARPAWVRITMWEALESNANWVASHHRRHFWRGTVRMLEEQQRRRELPAGIDAAQLQLALMAIVMFPYLLPQMTHFVTGMRADSDEFASARAAFLNAFAGLLTRS